MTDNRYNRFESFKALFHIEKLREIAVGNIPLPVEWVVYPTNTCPYNCGHCIMKVEKQSKHSLPDEVMKKIPVDAESLGIKTVIFSGGGEPLVHGMTMNTLRKLKDKGIETGLNTNGYFLTEDASCVDYLRVSVDAATKEMYHKVHGFDGWERVNENLKNLKRGKELGIAFLVTPDNWREIADFCAWAQQFNPDFIHIRPAYLGASYLGDEDELNILLPDLHKLKDALELKFPNVFFRLDKFNGYWDKKKYDKCRATPLMAVLAANGSFIICQDVFKRFGDYNKQSFEECWFGDDHKRAIESIDIAKCPRCVENGYNEIIENCVMKDSLKANLL